MVMDPAKYETGTSEPRRRHATWLNCANRAATYTDEWGNVLEAGVQAPVAALWGYGFSTRWSCEGHTDGRMPGPYVTIALDRDDDVPLGELQTRARRQRDRLRGLLDAYSSRFTPVGHTSRLILIPDPYSSSGRRFEGCAYRLMSEGAFPGLGQETGARLALHRREMSRFVEFLRHAFLGGEISAGPLGSSDQEAGSEIERLGDAPELRECGRQKASFDLGDVGGVDPTGVGELLLGEPGLGPRSSEFPTEGTREGVSRC
jgi:hypothetical protein